METIVLASASPRRKELVLRLGIPFSILPSLAEESIKKEVPLEKTAEALARLKVQNVLDSLIKEERKENWLVGADTVIILGQKIYGKPKDAHEAAEYIKALQAKTHTVTTGLALYNRRKQKLISRTCSTFVTFAAMSKEEIDWYINTGEWQDAAGAYKIQGLASCFIKKIEGSESCVMGLPLFDFYDMLVEQGYLFT